MRATSLGGMMMIIYTPLSLVWRKIRKARVRGVGGGWRKGERRMGEILLMLRMRPAAFLPFISSGAKHLWWFGTP